MPGMSSVHGHPGVDQVNRPSIEYVSRFMGGLHSGAGKVVPKSEDQDRRNKPPLITHLPTPQKAQVSL